jgi:hypothetical protein
VCFGDPRAFPNTDAGSYVAGKKPSILKRERERARDERNARKREERKNRASRESSLAGPPVATRDELGGYGLERGSSGDPFEDGPER